MAFVKLLCYNSHSKIKKGGRKMKRLDTTKGSIVKSIFIFALPLVLMTLVQHLFNIADKAVLGQMANATAVASVGVTSSITSLILNGFVGLATGTGIVLARFVGQKDEKKMKSLIETALISSVLFGCIVAVVGVIFAPQFLRLINCPQECFEGARQYFRIYIASAPAALLYNYGAVIVRTLGDTKRPLIYIMISGIINVVLNVILCLILPQKVIAVAIATAVSKIVSAILVIRCIFRFDEVVKLSFRKIHFDLNSLKLILKFGIPVSISNLLLPIANLQIVPQINSYGVAATAGNTAATDICTVPSSFISGFSAATSTFMGQNIGAQKKDRVSKIFWLTLLFAVLFGGSIGIFLYLTGEFWVGIVIGTSSAEAIEYGMIRMFYVTAFSFINAYNSVLGSAEHAYGYPFLGTLKTILCVFVFRIVWMNFVYPLEPTFDMVMLCFTVSWILNAIFNTIAVSIISIRYRKGLYKKI